MTPEQRDAIRELAPDLAIAKYGDKAILGPSPPGPDTCPGSCDQCYHTDVPVLQPREQVQDERMRGVG